MKSKLIVGMTLCIGGALLATSCSDDKTEISAPIFTVGKVVSNDAPLTGAVKGTMETGKTYYIDGEVTVNEGDTLLLQPGVKVYAKSKASAFIVKGVFLSLGTKEQPNLLGVEGMSRKDDPSQDPATDPAYEGLWGGIICSDKCPKLIVKWTHIEYCGSHFQNPPLEGLSDHGYYWGITFLNPDGVCVVEDSWMYGANTEGVRIMGGNISIMRNTFEKISQQVGDAMTIKGKGAQGDVAYNVFIGCASQPIIVDHNGSTNRQTTVHVYNNTIINSGWRTARANEVYGITFFRDAAGKVYNNAIINCRGGFFLDPVKKPNLEKLEYGNNYFYADTKAIADAFYPWGSLTEPQATDIPTPASYLPVDFHTGDEYDGSAVVGNNGAQFVNFTLPETGSPASRAYLGSADLHLQASSPLVGKGYTGFSALKRVPLDEKFGASEITEPSSDIGAYQSNGKGNQH